MATYERVGPQYEHDPTTSAMKASSSLAPSSYVQPQAPSQSLPANDVKPISRPASTSQVQPATPSSTSAPPGTTASPSPASGSLSQPAPPGSTYTPAGTEPSSVRAPPASSARPEALQQSPTAMQPADRPPPGRPGPPGQPQQGPAPPSGQKKPQQRCFKDAGGVEICYKEAYEHANKTDIYDQNGTYDRHNDYHDIKHGDLATNKNTTDATRPGGGNDLQQTEGHEWSGDGGFRDTHIEQGKDGKSPVYEDHKEFGGGDGQDWQTHSSHPDGSGSDFDFHSHNDMHTLNDVKDKDGATDTFHQDSSYKDSLAQFEQHNGNGRETEFNGHLSSESNHQSEEHKDKDSYSFHEETNSHGDFGFHYDDNQAVTNKPNPATKRPAVLAARSNYPPATHSVPAGKDLPHGCGHMKPLGHRGKCKLKPTKSPQSSSGKTEALRTSAATSLLVKTVWVDVPEATHVKRSIEHDDDVDKLSEESTHQDTAHLPAEIKAFTEQEVPIVPDEQQALAQPKASKADKNGALYQHVVQDILPENVQAHNLTVLFEQRLRNAVARIDAQIAHRMELEKRFYTISLCFLFCLLLLIAYSGLQACTTRQWEREQKQAAKKLKAQQNGEEVEEDEDVEGKIRDVEKGVVGKN